MKRKILFKAKQHDKNEWVHGDLLHTDDNERTFIAVPIAEPNVVSLNFQSRCIAVAPTTICQCTYIQDKDGNDIYEHDLVQDIKTKAIYEVVWNDVYACYSFLDRYNNVIAAKNFADYRTKEMLVVGNVYDEKQPTTSA